MSSVKQQVNYGLVFITDLANDLDNETLDLPVFPDVVLRIKSALEDPEVTADKIAQLISTDPVFSARILKIANSALVNGAGAKIDNIRTAITRMGFNMAYNTSVSIAVDALKSNNVPSQILPYLQECWHHSVMVAAYAYVIARKKTRINPDTALLAGLLHDIGKYYILSHAKDYPELFDMPETLEEILNEWHTGVGKGILEAWNFSEEFCAVTDEHEEINRHSEDLDLTDIIIVANIFAHREDEDFSQKFIWNEIPATQQLELDEESAVALMLDSEEKIKSIVSTLEG